MVQTHSNSTVPKYEWLVIVPDHADALDKRMAVRAEHFAALRPTAEAGLVALGGGTLASQPVEHQPLQLNGTAIILYADSKEAVLKELQADVYCTAGVWDMDKVQILPFKSGVRNAL